MGIIKQLRDEYDVGSGFSSIPSIRYRERSALARCLPGTDFGRPRNLQVLYEAETRTFFVEYHNAPHDEIAALNHFAIPLCRSLEPGRNRCASKPVSWTIWGDSHWPLDTVGIWLLLLQRVKRWKGRQRDRHSITQALWHKQTIIQPIAA
jgi:hypothetical protein